MKNSQMKQTAHSIKQNLIRSLTQLGTVYSRDLAEFTKEEIMAMCPKVVVEIPVPRRDDGDRPMELLIIKLEFEKDTLDPHITIEEEIIQLRI